MKNIKTYDNFLNESLFSIKQDELDKAIEAVSKHIPSKLIDVIQKNMDKLEPFYNKYFKNGELQLDKMKFLLSVEEGTNWYSNNEENKFVNILKKVFGFPIVVVQYLIKFIRDGFETHWFMGSFAILTLAAIIFSFGFVGHVINEAIDKARNGIEQGIVISAEPKFVKAHMVYTPKTRYWQIDAWYFEVKDDETNRIEQWFTEDPSKLDDIEKGDKVDNKDFMWKSTIEK